MTLRAADISVRRGAGPVVKDASLTLRPGEVAAIVGPNGAGKSTLLAALGGLMPVEGSVLLDDRPLGELAHRERARSIGFLPQHAEVAWDVSVRTLVELGRLPWRAVPGRPARAAREQDEAAVNHALCVMELDDLTDRPVSNLSGGERARAMMARVLAGQPRWILADEPLASLDLAHQQRLSAQLRAEAERGLGVAVVMHDLAAAMNKADRVIVIDRGRIVADSPPEQALTHTYLREVWHVEGEWIGERGQRALIVR